KRHVDHSKPGAPVSFRDDDRRQASFADGLPEVRGVLMLLVAVAPIIEPARRADSTSRLDEHRLRFIKSELHRSRPGGANHEPWKSALRFSRKARHPSCASLLS